MAHVLGHLHHMGALEEALGSWLWNGQALVVAIIWRVNWKIEDSRFLPLFVTLTFQAK